MALALLRIAYGSGHHCALWPWEAVWEVLLIAVVSAAADTTALCGVACDQQRPEASRRARSVAFRREGLRRYTALGFLVDTCSSLRAERKLARCGR